MNGLLCGKGKVLIVTGYHNISHQRRVEGFRHEIKMSSRHRLLPVVACQDKRDIARELVKHFKNNLTCKVYITLQMVS